MSGKCDSERKEEMKLMAPMQDFPPKRWEAKWMGRRMKAHGDLVRAQSLKCGGREGQRLDCSPGSANVLTRVARADSPSPQTAGRTKGFFHLAAQMAPDHSHFMRIPLALGFPLLQPSYLSPG